MRSAVLSAILLFLTLSVGIGCSASACAILRHTAEEIETLPSDSVPAFDDIEKIVRNWEEKSRFLAVTVNYVWLSQAENAMTALRSSVLCDDSCSLSRFLSAKEAVLSALSTLEKAEGVSVQSFF